MQTKLFIRVSVRSAATGQRTLAQSTKSMHEEARLDLTSLAALSRDQQQEARDGGEGKATGAAHAHLDSPAAGGMAWRGAASGAALVGTPLDSSGRPLLGPDGQPISIPPCSIGPGGVILDANGNPMVGADGRPLVAASIAPAAPSALASLSALGMSLGPGGVLLGADGRPMLDAYGREIRIPPCSIAADGTLLDADGKPVVGADGHPILSRSHPQHARGHVSGGAFVGPDGAVLDASRPPLLGPDGQPISVPPCSIGPGGVILDANGNPMVGADGRPLTVGGADGAPRGMTRGAEYGEDPTALGLPALDPELERDLAGLMVRSPARRTAGNSGFGGDKFSGRTGLAKFGKASKTSPNVAAARRGGAFESVQRLLPGGLGGDESDEEATSGGLSLGMPVGPLSAGGIEDDNDGDDDGNDGDLAGKIGSSGDEQGSGGEGSSDDHGSESDHSSDGVGGGDSDDGDSDEEESSSEEDSEGADPPGGGGIVSPGGTIAGHIKEVSSSRPITAPLTGPRAVANVATRISALARTSGVGGGRAVPPNARPISAPPLPSVRPAPPSPPSPPKTASRAAAASLGTSARLAELKQQMRVLHALRGHIEPPAEPGGGSLPSGAGAGAGDPFAEAAEGASGTGSSGAQGDSVAAAHDEADDGRSARELSLAQLLASVGFFPPRQLRLPAGAATPGRPRSACLPEAGWAREHQAAWRHPTPKPTATVAKGVTPPWPPSWRGAKVINARDQWYDSPRGRAAQGFAARHAVHAAGGIVGAAARPLLYPPGAATGTSLAASPQVDASTRNRPALGWRRAARAPTMRGTTPRAFGGVRGW